MDPDCRGGSMSEETPRPLVVIDGVLQYTSVSAIAKFDTCQAQWWHRYVARRPEEGSPAMDYGIGAHARVRSHILGQEVELAETEKVMIPFLPIAGHGLFLEQSVEAGTRPLFLGSIPMHGSADAILVQPGEAWVSDWKFKSNIGKWATKAADLTDVAHADGRQLLAYAAWTVNNYLVQTVNVRHVTSQTGGIAADGSAVGPFRATATAGAPLSRQDVTRKWAAVEARFEKRLIAAAAAPSDAGVVGNLDACRKYNRLCPYAGVCSHYQKDQEARKLAKPTPAARKVVSMKAPEATPAAVETPAAPSKPNVVLYFGGSYPIGYQTLTLHTFLADIEEAIARERGEDSKDIRQHAKLDFGKWKAPLGAMARAMLSQLPPGHYLVHSEERIQIVAGAIMPLVHAVGGPNL